MKTVHGKTIVITGAGSGIGRALALRCAAEGARVALCDVDEAAVEGTRERAAAHGARALAARVDVSRGGDLERFAARVRGELGGADVLVNNAGVSLSATAAEMSQADFEWLFDINFWGVVHGVRAFLPQLVDRPEAHIVNVSSVFGLIALPTQAAYNASKFAVRGYTEALRQELSGTGVRVTCVHPGGVRTNIIRGGRHYRGLDGRAATTDEIARDFEVRLARTSPEDAARAILEGILRERPRVLIGLDARFLDLLQRLFPASYDRITTAFLRFKPEAPSRELRSADHAAMAEETASRESRGGGTGGRPSHAAS